MNFRDPTSPGHRGRCLCRAPGAGAGAGQGEQQSLGRRGGIGTGIEHQKMPAQLAQSPSRSIQLLLLYCQAGAALPGPGTRMEGMDTAALL